MATGKRPRHSGIRDLLSDIAEFEAAPESAGHELRLDLAEIVLRHLDGRQWTQRKLADAAGMKSPFITRITHAAQNCTFDVAGRLLFALGVKAKLVETRRRPSEETLVANPGEAYGETQTVSNAQTSRQGADTFSATSAA